MFALRDLQMEHAALPKMGDCVVKSSFCARQMRYRSRSWEHLEQNTISLKEICQFERDGEFGSLNSQDSGRAHTWKSFDVLSYCWFYIDVKNKYYDGGYGPSIQKNAYP